MEREIGDVVKSAIKSLKRISIGVIVGASALGALLGVGYTVYRYSDTRQYEGTHVGHSFDGECYQLHLRLNPDERGIRDEVTLSNCGGLFADKEEIRSLYLDHQSSRLLVTTYGSSNTDTENILRIEPR